MAMTSEATVMMKPSSLGTPLIFPPRPMTMFRRARSFMSRQRLISTRRGSMPRGLPCCMWLSSMAQHRLLAEVMACMSPVK